MKKIYQFVKCKTPECPEEIPLWEASRPPNDAAHPYKVALIVGDPGYRPCPNCKLSRAYVCGDVYEKDVQV